MLETTVTKMDSDHVESGIRSLLASSRIFDTFLKVVGYPRAMKALAHDHIKAFQSARVVDIACGTSPILHFLPDNIEYRGYDFNPEYIERNKERFKTNPRFQFFASRASEGLKDEDRFDIALALSALHHMNDEEAGVLISEAHRVLKPGGRFITYDPMFHSEQSIIERSIMNMDRGKHIRTLPQYRALTSIFDKVDLHQRSDMGWRIPATVCIMECTKL
jgi:ubiquinone/menaquinone biosynthesis C-methylase UbiE